LTQELLQLRGHMVRLANNGPETLAAWQEAPVDVLLLDVQMPGMSGFEVASHIRAEEKTSGRHLPIVALTARAMKGDRERCLEAGMDDYLAKPIQPEDLYAVIEHLGQGSAGSVAPTSGVPEPFDRPALMTRLRGNTALLAKMAQIFLEVSPQWVEEIRAAIDRGEAAQVGEIAHTLKGSVGNFEATAAVTAALRLETMGRANDLMNAAAALKELEETLGPLGAALAQLCGPGHVSVKEGGGPLPGPES
jgi:CheY-like chemotaxis protein